MSPSTFIICVLALVVLSAICSGLNIALMSLKLPDLKRQAKLGNKYARRVLPLRKNAHLSLASIVLTNVGVISATTLVLDDYLSGIFAGLFSTLLIVIFGELAPQALFTRHALVACGRLAPLLRLMIVFTYPVSKPLQLAMDKLFGVHSDIGLYSRRELGLMINEHTGQTESELDDDEVEIIKGALQLSEKQASDIMTPIERVFWLQPSTIIDGDKINDIKAAGRSRIPIFNPKLTKCYGILLMKDLVDIDFDENNCRVDQLRMHSTKLVGARTALDTMFRRFIAARTHLIPVERNEEIIGIMTIEDLIEEIIGHEIIDESDHDNKRT